MTTKQIQCPKCTNESPSLLEKLYEVADKICYLCGVCSKMFFVDKEK